MFMGLDLFLQVLHGPHEAGMGVSVTMPLGKKTHSQSAVCRAHTGALVQACTGQAPSAERRASVSSPSRTPRIFGDFLWSAGAATS